MRARLARKFEDKTKKKTNYEQKLCYQEQKEREEDEIIKRRGEKEREEKTDLSENAAWKQEKKTMARIQYK